MKFFSLFVLVAFIAGPFVLAQEESPAPSPAEEKASATVETAPQPAAETPAPTPAPKSSPATGGSPAAQKAATKSASPSAAKAPAASAGKTMGVEATLKEMENKWADAYAKHDAAAIEPMVAEDFVGVNPEGKVQNRRALLAEAKSTKETYTSEKNEKLEVRRYGNNVAIVIGTAREKGSDKSGKKFDRTYRFTDTWIDRGGKWQCVASQLSLVAHK
jgi:ketosteroid isomerase-like protein